MRNFGRGTKFYQKAMGEQKQQANNAFEEEKRGPFGHVRDSREPSDADEDAERADNKLDLLPKRNRYAQLRNHSASPRSSSGSSDSGDYKIEFDDKDRVKDGYSSTLGQPMGMTEYVISRELESHGLTPVGRPLTQTLEKRLEEMEASSRGKYGQALSRQERQNAIRQHNATLDAHKVMAAGSGSFGGGTQWTYDPDEENTPSQGIELKPMSLEAATGVGAVKESPLQNHFISGQSHNRQFSTEDYHQMFAQADARANAKRQAADINVSMAHAGGSESEGLVGISRHASHKSRIGGGGRSSLQVANSKAARTEVGEPASLNNQSAKELSDYLQSKYVQPASERKPLAVSKNEQELQDHMKTQREEAKARKDHKITNQLKRDPVPSLREREGTEAAAKAARQLELRRKKKEEEQKASSGYRSVQAYNVGDGLGAKAESYFTRGGREQSERESQGLREESLKQLSMALTEQDKRGRGSSGSPAAEVRGLVQGASEYLARAHLHEPREGSSRSRFGAALEASKRDLEQSQPAWPSTSGFDPGRFFDTVHPSKLGQAQGQITDVRQNMLLPQHETYASTFGRGLTGSSLGFGSADPSSSFQTGVSGSEGLTEAYARQQQSQRDLAGAARQQSKIGQSQYRYTGNAATSGRSDTFGGDAGLQRAFAAQSRQPHQLAPGVGQYAYGRGPGQSQAGSTLPGCSGAAASSKSSLPSQQPAGKASFFYESSSKVISLKKFSDDLQFSGSSSAKSIYSPENRQANKDISLMKWFEKLVNHEKAIVFTVVDSELVQLLKQMHAVYAQYGHGHFQSEYPERQLARSPHEGDRYEKVPGYSLLFEKPSYTVSLSQASGRAALSPYGGLNGDEPYDWYGPTNLKAKHVEAGGVQSKVVKEQQAVEDNLIHNINLVKVGGEEAITLHNELLENTDFLLKMLQTIDPSFMHSELKIEKTDVATAMAGSVVRSKQEATSQEDSQPQTASRKQQGRTRDQDLFFTLNERDGKAVSQARPGVTAADFRSRTSQYAKMGTRSHPQSLQAAALDSDVHRDSSRLTFAHVLCHVFEKAINIQYQEFQGKLSHQMKDFFFVQVENHIYNEDVKLAKFWLDLKADEQADIWSRAAEAGDEVFREIKAGEAFKKSKGFEDIQEEPNDCSEESAEEVRSKPYRRRQSAAKLRPAIFAGAKDSSRSTEEWKEQMKQVQDDINERHSTIDAQAARLAQASTLSRQYVDWDERDGSEEESKTGLRGRAEPDSEDTDSDDIEKNYNQGYKLLQSRETSGSHRPGTRGAQAARGFRIPNYAKVQGQGFRALDSNNSNSGSRTVTESEDSDNNHNKSYQTQDYLKAVYSTKMDKELSEGEIVFSEVRGQREDSERYASNYESDEFEDEDPDDDFNLPRNHLQNNEAYGQLQTNIKAQILKKDSSSRPPTAKKPEFISTGSQATSLTAGKASSKATSSGKPTKALEEQKQVSSTASRAQLVQNQEAQKELQIRAKFKAAIDKLREAGAKAIASANMDLCYLFIRSISTSASFASLTRIKDGFYLEQGLKELHERIYKILQAQQQSKLISDLLDHTDKAGKGANQSAANVGQPNQPTHGNASKKNKKKKQKDKAAKELAERQQLEKQGVNLAEQKVEVIDDIVLVSGKPAPTQEESKNGKALPSEQPGEQTKAKSKIRSRKNKKKKKAPAQDGEEKDKKEPGDEVPTKADELTPKEQDESKVQMDNQGSLEKGSGQRNFPVPEQLTKSAEKNAKGVREMLRSTPLDSKDFIEHLMSSSTQSLDERKRELSLLVEQDQQITSQENRLQVVAKQVLLDGHMTDSMSNLSSASQPLTQGDRKVDLSQDKLTKSIAERTSLLRGDVQYDKYPEIHGSGSLTALERRKEDHDLDKIGDELMQDEDMRMFTPVGVRKRDPADIRRAVEDLDNDMHNASSRQEPGYKQLMRENAALVADLSDLNDQVVDMGQFASGPAVGLVRKKQPEMKFTDLREEKLLKEKQRQQQLKHASDYSEKAREVPDDEGEADVENKDQKKKKKKKRKAKKKATANEGETAQVAELKFPESIEKAGEQLVRDSREQEKIHRQRLNEQSSEWQNMLERTLAEEKRSENMDDDASSDQNQFFDDDFMEREELVGLLHHKHSEEHKDQVVSHESINLEFQEPAQATKPRKAITVDLERCRQQCAAANKAASAISMLEKVKDLQPETSVEARRPAGLINDSDDLNDKANIDLTKRLAQNCAGIHTGGQFSSIDPVIPLNAQDAIDEEIPEDLPVAEASDERAVVTENQKQVTLNKKKQAKADKKKEAKQNAKLKAQQQKQKEAEMKAQKEQRRKELQEKKQLMSQSKKMTEPKENEEEETIENLQQIIKTQRKDLKMPGLNVLNQAEGKTPSHSSSVVRAQSKRVQFQRDASYDGSTKIPKRGSSRGTSIASSNKNKQDDILQELDGLFAQEYKKPQQSIIESLNTSKKNTPDNSSSKQNKIDTQDLNDQILQKKLEDLQLASDEHRKPKGNARSSSLPLTQAPSASTERKPKPEEPKQDGSRPVATKKEKQTREKQKILLDQSYAQIQPQPSIQIIKPEPKLTKQQKKKLNKERNQQEAQGLKAEKSTATKNDGAAQEKPQNAKASSHSGAQATQPSSSKKEKPGSNANAAKEKGQPKDAGQATQPTKPGEEVKVPASSRKKQKKQAALNNMLASQDLGLQQALYNNMKDTSHAASHPLNSQQLAVGPAARQPEPAVGQQRLQQLLMGDSQIPMGEEAKRSNAAAEVGSSGGSRVQAQHQRPGNQSVNSQAVAQGQMDHSQILKNIETYTKKQAFQSQGLPPQASNHLMHAGASQGKNVSPAQYFMEQGLNLNQMFGNQMMNPNQMFVPTAAQPAQQPVAQPEQNSQGAPSQTINIDIISISYQQTMQQANPGRQSSLQQTNILNLQNKQVTANNPVGQVPNWQQPSQQLALPANSSSAQQLQNAPSPQQMQMVTQPQPQQFTMMPSNLANGNSTQFANQNTAQQFLGMHGPSYNYNGQGLNPQNYMNYSNLGFPNQYPPAGQGNQNNAQALNPNFNGYFNQLAQLNTPGPVNQQMSNFNNMFMGNQFAPSQPQYMNQSQNSMAAFNAAQQTQPKQNQQMAAAANAVAAAQNMMALNSGGSAGGSPSQMPFMQQSNQQQMNMLSQFNMFQQMMNQQNGMNNHTKLPPNVMAQNMSSFLQNQQNQFFQQMQQVQQQQQMIKNSQQTMTATASSSSPNPAGAQGLPASQSSQGQTDLSQIDSTGHATLQPQSTTTIGAPGQPVPVKIADQLDRNHLSENSSAFIPASIRNQAGNSQRAQPSSGSKTNVQVHQHGRGAARGTPDGLGSGQTQFGGGPQKLFQPTQFVPGEANVQGIGQGSYVSQMPNSFVGPAAPANQSAMARGMPQHAGQPLPNPAMGGMQNCFTPQQEYLLKIQQLQAQGYVMPNNLQDQAALFGLNQQELSHVHEFYEVLDAQIDRVKDDQSSKLKKAQQLRDIAFGLIKSKILLVYELKQRAKGLDPSACSNVKVEIYGSMATGLAIDSSDLDILVHGFIDPDSPRYQQLSRDELIEELQMLHSALNDVFAIKQNNLIDTASVPVIKLQMDLVQICKSEKQKNGAFEVDPEHLDEETKVLHIDITLDEPKNTSDQQHLGIQCCNYIKARIEEHPDLKILALIFKKFLSLKNLNKPYAGGLSSYSLIQMILAVLKLIERETGLAQPRLSISMIFKKFVWEYGCNFLPQVRAISQHCEILDRSTLGYILHSPQCCINTDLDGDALQFEDECDCGYTLMNSHRAGPEGSSGAGGKDQQTLIDLLQKLIHKDDEQPARPVPNLNPAHHHSPTLVIIDPLNRFNNIGKSSYNFAVIQQEFRDVYQRLSEEMVMFVKSCCQKQNGAGVQQPYDVDGLVSRILRIDYKLSTPFEERPEQAPASLVKPAEETHWQPSTEFQKPASKGSPGSSKSSKKTPKKQEVEPNQVEGAKHPKSTDEQEERKRQPSTEVFRDKQKQPQPSRPLPAQNTAKPQNSQAVPVEGKKARKGKGRKQK